MISSSMLMDKVLKDYEADIIALQVMDKQISVLVMSTIVATLLGTNSVVALQWPRISETSSQDLL